MKPLLQLFLLLALALVLTQSQPLSALPPVDAQASTISGAPLPAPASPTASSSLSGAAPAAPIPPELGAEGDPDVPVKGSHLVLVSLIGFGLLIGGIVPAMRTRKPSGTHS
jgi:hypothetical protein